MEDVVTTAAPTPVAAPKPAPTPKPKAAVKPKAVAKPKAPANGKPAPKPKTAAPAANGGEFGVERSHDLPWNDKKVAVFKALKALKAVGVDNARSAAEVAAKAKLSGRDVRHYVYHAKASGLTGVAKVEGIAGYGFYLTAKGDKVDPAAELKSAKA